jgi:hypothetical protein
LITTANPKPSANPNAGESCGQRETQHGGRDVAGRQELPAIGEVERCTRLNAAGNRDADRCELSDHGEECRHSRDASDEEAIHERCSKAGPTGGSARKVAQRARRPDDIRVLAPRDRITLTPWVHGSPESLRFA